MNNLARILVPAILPITQCRQSHGNFWWCNWNGLEHHYEWTIHFVEYPVGQYPKTMVKCAQRNVDKQCHRFYEGKYMDLRNSSQQYQPKHWELLVMSGLNCTMLIYITLNVSVFQNLVCPSPVKSTHPLKKGFLSHCWRSYRQNQADLQLVFVANGMGRATVHGEPAALQCTHIRQLQFNECWYGNSPLHFSMFFYINYSWTSPSSKVYHTYSRVNSTSLPDVITSSMKHGFGSLYWEYLSVHNFTAAIPLPWALSKIICILTYSRNV